MVVGVSLVFEGESTVTDVIQILQPLKVRNCHTAGVQIHVLKQGQRTQGNRERTQGEEREGEVKNTIMQKFHWHFIVLAATVLKSTDRDHHDVSLQEDAVGFGRGRTVRSLSDDLKVTQTGQFTEA